MPTCIFKNQHNMCMFLLLFSDSGEYTLAAELYREVLQSSEEHKEKLKTDSLQVSEHSNVKRNS